MKKIFFILTAFVCSVQAKNFVSFEANEDASNWRGQFETSSERAYEGDKSLKWQWLAGDLIKVDTDVNYLPQQENTVNKALSTFSCWIYNEQAINDSLRFSFLKAGKEHCYFEFNLNFTGWRTCWVSFERDMQAKPVKGMDQIILRAPQKLESGTLFIDHFIASSQVDPRHQIPDRQVPFVNKAVVVNANKHWMALDYFASQKKHQYQLSSEDKIAAQKVESRFQVIHQKKFTLSDSAFNKIKKQFEYYTSGRGKTVLLNGHGAVYNGVKTKKFLDDQIDVKRYTAFMLQLARAYDSASGDRKSKLADMFIKTYQNIHKYGWAYGSGLGTIHHLGYALRNYYPSLVLMKAELKKAGLLEQAYKDMYWFSGFGKVYEPFETAGFANIDILNTTSMGMLATALMADGNEAQNIKAFQFWLNRGLNVAPGLKAPLKADGSLYHHRNHYPAYGKDALRGISPVIYLLSGGSLRLAEENHRAVNKCLYMMRNYCNLREWPLSVSGRHPLGNGGLDPQTYYWMAKSGSPGGKKEVDPKMAATFLRLVKNDRKFASQSLELMAKGIEAESAPEGNWSMNYASFGIHRRGDWMFSVKGFSRYLWGAEIYKGANHYGRYLSNGHYQIMNLSERLNMAGWNWNYLPGTTSVVIPYEELRANVLQVDEFSGYEELLISDETFAGSLSFENNGMYSMKLHSHPKYGKDLRAFKSYFMFDDMVICLGDGISSIDDKNPTVTTLFQHQGQRDLNTDSNVFDDGKGNLWKVVEGELKQSSGKQLSPNQKTDVLEDGTFTKAWIDHGKAPKDASYEYAFKIQDKDKKFPYEVLQKDSEVHGVLAHETEAFAISTIPQTINSSFITSVSSPCMFMAKKEGEILNLTICDPDLHLYEGRDESQYESGLQKEVSIYSRKWGANESVANELRIKLNKSYKLKINSSKLRIVNGSELIISCQHAENIDLQLIEL
ncbi:chondroitinase family polysaccharide lyase [Lentisphaera marina]|uniref:chondroitinase family polysaccharide lyase n=1 Tax=Lentisphaera marina TaxID=1111041 RepID=UPI00236710B9|nr:chondroitinase family polysaccharide lyase [Lentisphaera marina]MDD7987453.1 chondroitinase family polysaccharide lyase [Lentisphaera marina]